MRNTLATLAAAVSASFLCFVGSMTAAMAAESLSVADAEKLVREFAIKIGPGTDQAAQFPLEEITPDDVRGRLGAQVFRVKDGPWASETLLIRNGEVASLGVSLLVVGASRGGHGVGSMCVTDLDANGQPELVFAFSFGLGVHCSTVGILRADAKPFKAERAGFTFFNRDCTLERVDDRSVRILEAKVTYAEGKPVFQPGRAIATITHDKAAGKWKITLADGLDDGTRAAIRLDAPPGPTEPTKRTTDRARDLKAELHAFTLDLRYVGPDDRTFRSMTLRVPMQDTGCALSGPAVQVSKDEAAAIVDHLAKDGFLERGLNVAQMDISPPRGPTYVLEVSGPRELVIFENLGWNAAMVSRLEALRKVLTGDAARKMDLVLAPLAEQKKKWEAPK